jgi:hypothetical protein
MTTRPHTAHTPTPGLLIPSVKSRPMPRTHIDSEALKSVVILQGPGGEPPERSVEAAIDEQCLRTSWYGAAHMIHRYLLRDLQMDRPNQVWCTNIEPREALLQRAAMREHRHPRISIWAPEPWPGGARSGRDWLVPGCSPMPDRRTPVLRTARLSASMEGIQSRRISRIEGPSRARIRGDR